MRVGGGHLLRRLHGVAQLAEVVAAEGIAHLGEVVGLLLLDVVAHVLHEDGDLGVEALVLGVHALELRAMRAPQVGVTALVVAKGPVPTPFTAATRNV